MKRMFFRYLSQPNKQTNHGFNKLLSQQGMGAKENTTYYS